MLVAAARRGAARLLTSGRCSLQPQGIPEGHAESKPGRNKAGRAMMTIRRSKKAFDLNTERPGLRKEIRPDMFGQACLLAGGSSSAACSSSTVTLGRRRHPR